MVDVPVPKARIGQLFASPSDEGRMFPITYSEAKKENTLGLTFAGKSKAAPASVRFYNPGAVAARSDDGHKLLGAIETSDLPGSDGNPLSTAAFEKPEDGIAYFGYWVQARVVDQRKQEVNIDNIIDAYQTGSPEGYKDYVAGRTGLKTDKELDDDQLASVARAMFEWESGGTNPYSLNAQANRRMMEGIDNNDIKAQISRGRTAYKTQEDPGIPASDPIADVIAANEAVVVPASLNNNTSANDSIGAALTSMAQTTNQSLSDVLSPQIAQTMTMTLDIDTSPDTMAQRIAQQKESPAFSDAVFSHAMETGQLDKFGTMHYDPELKRVARY